MNARTRTYRVGADGHGANVGWVATAGRASGNNGYAARDDGTQLTMMGRVGRRQVLLEHRRV